MEGFFLKLSNLFFHNNILFYILSIVSFILLSYLSKEDKNKFWDYSSIKKNKPSERIIYFENKIEIRSNWIIDGVVFDVDKSVENLFIEE